MHVHRLLEDGLSDKDDSSFVQKGIPQGWLQIKRYEQNCTLILLINRSLFSEIGPI